MHFAWDSAKEAQNRRKHDVAFEEAQTVFADENALLLDDPGHSDAEDRYVMLGLSCRFRVLVVAHTLRGNGIMIRLISARKATKRERKQYFEQVVP